MLKLLVKKRNVLVDDSVTNSARVKNSVWHEVTQKINSHFGLEMKRETVRKKWNDEKYASKKKVTKAIEQGSRADGERIAKTWGEYRRHGRGTGGGPPLYPPDDNLVDGDPRPIKVIQEHK